MRDGGHPSGSPRLLVGTAGWSYRDWEGIVYPRRRSRTFHPLAHLARYVPVVEVNSSFYAPPPPAMVARWVEVVADRPAFRFTAKLDRVLTHGDDAGAMEPAAAAWREGMAPLVEAGRLEAALAQFPVTFRHGPFAERRLARIRELLPDVPLVVEVRHRSFFEPGAQRHLADLGVSVAHVDLPPARDHPPASHPSLGAVGYVRLHGRNAATWFARGVGRDERYDHLYAPRALDEITDRVRAVIEETDLAVVIANNHPRGQALAAALELRARLEDETPTAPDTLVAAYPHLRDVVRVEGQQTLF